VELSRTDARRPDVVTAELKKGFEWTTQHSQLVGGVVALALIVGGGSAVWSSMSASREASLQEKFYELEKTYLEKKEKFDLYQNTANRPADPKTKEVPKPEGEKASGDLTTDYGPVVTSLENLVKENQGSKAAALAAMTLTRIYDDYQKPTEALEVLKKVENTRGVLGALAKLNLGTHQADAGDCKAAMDTWSGLLKNHDAAFLSAQVKLKMGVCSENLNQKSQAEDYYKQVIGEAKESAAGRSAEKFLRLLQTKNP
jgi:predicted negative regulator of RcsB-dependent stress response